MDSRVDHLRVLTLSATNNHELHDDDDDDDDDEETRCRGYTLVVRGFHEDGPTSVLEILRTVRDREQRSRGLGNLGRNSADFPICGSSLPETAKEERKRRKEDTYTHGRRERKREIDTRTHAPDTHAEGREDGERRTAKEGSARRDHRIRQSNGGFSTDDDKDTRQRSPTLYFAFNDQGTSTAESGGLRPPVGF